MSITQGPGLPSELKDNPELYSELIPHVQELSDWYAANTIQLEKLRTSNRAAMENMDRTYVSQIEPLQPGTEWER